MPALFAARCRAAFAPLLVLAGVAGCAQPEAAAVAATPAPGEPAAFAGMLAAHQRWRQAVGTPPLVWSAAAARRAQAWADELARRGCQIAHSPELLRHQAYGENVYGYARGGDYRGYRRSPAQVVERWAGERDWYDAAAGACDAPAGETCGHYTQVVSTYSTHVGCGRARCAAAEVWVCQYAPPGNYADARPFPAAPASAPNGP